MDFKTTTPIISAEHTKMFLKQMDLAFSLLDLKILKEIIERFELQHLEDTPEFLEDAPEKFNVKTESETARITEVLPYNSKCIACVYGKSVKGYIIRVCIAGPGGSRIHYQRYFAMNYMIVKGQLTDFGWCHSFLHPEEMEELNA